MSALVRRPRAHQQELVLTGSVDGKARLKRLEAQIRAEQRIENYFENGARRQDINRICDQLLDVRPPNRVDRLIRACCWAAAALALAAWLGYRLSAS